MVFLMKLFPERNEIPPWLCLCRMWMRDLLLYIITRLTFKPVAMNPLSVCNEYS